MKVGEEGLRLPTFNFDNIFNYYVLEVNIDKTKYMIVGGE